jgi:cytoskeletal protein CcmA (bactofilin family)
MTTIGLGDDVRCSGNFYAFENIILAKNAVVEMPAFAFVRGVLKGNALTSSCGVRLSGESRFSGIVFCEQGFTYSSIEKNARFTGLFYTRGYLALEGTVYGCVAAQRMKKDLAGDKNEFAGGMIDRKMLPKNFTVPCAFGQNKRGVSEAFKLVSWKESFSAQENKGQAQ